MSVDDFDYVSEDAQVVTFFIGTIMLATGGLYR